ncbi:unnamed protein product [Porites lobata]|uniref:Nephrocystin-3 n=1 Tax=Porites lobata TaxID=104759 RepID=A0ABN8S563_9CNID|nr:unnamed protein product [Porites lobata]
MALQPYQDEELNFFKFASLVLNEFPKALRQKFKSMWDGTYGHRPGFKLWDDCSAVRILFASLEGDKNKVPIHTSYNEWDCTALFQATIYAQSFACGRSFTLSDLYLKPLALPHDSFHASVTSPCGNEEETLALAIDQLRLLRNSLCHSVRSLMDRETFDERMKQAKDAFTALGVVTDLLDAVASLDESHFPTNEVHTLNKKIRKESQTCVQMLEDVVANVEEWKRDTATKQDIAILSLKIDELKAAQEIPGPKAMAAEVQASKETIGVVQPTAVATNNLAPEKHESTADSYYSLGITQLEKDDLKPALKSLQSALTIRVKLFGEKHKATAESYYSIGLTQQKMGSLRPALQSFRRVLAINIKLFGEEQESVRTADIYVHLWTIQHELGYFKSALHSKKRALAIRISLLFGEEHKSTAESYHSLGITQQELGDLKSALLSHRRALDICFKLFGEIHENTADSYYQLGIIQRKLGFLRAALNCHQHVISIRIKLFGEKHKCIADSYYSLGIARRGLGDLKSALRSNQRALAIRIELFGEEHKCTADSYYLL